MSDDWNNILANQAIRTLWLKNSDADEIRRQRHAAIDALIGISPRDELEGMIAAQLIACHSASMECYRRAMIGEQTFEGRRENLNQANKLSRTYATLLEALNRHRGKGTQRVTVEHVHVHEGGQAIVGRWRPRGVGHAPKSKEQPHAIANAPGAPMPSTDAARDRCQSPAMPNGRCRMHGGLPRALRRAIRTPSSMDVIRQMPYRCAVKSQGC